MELVGPSWRVFVTVAWLIFWSVGYIILAALAYAITGWRYLQAALTVLDLLLFVAFIMYVVYRPNFEVLAQGNICHQDVIKSHSYLFTRGGVLVPGGCLIPGGVWSQGVSPNRWLLVSIISRGGVCPGFSGGRGFSTGIRSTFTAGTHPTGSMHSCLLQFHIFS